MMQGDLFNNGDQNELNSDASDLGHRDFQSEEPETSGLKSDSSFPSESNDANSTREALDS